MRISDWSSDVCSSDLMHELGRVLDYFDQTRPAGVIIQSGKEAGFIAGADIDEFAGLDTSAKGMELVSDRKRVGSGKSVSVRVDLGGRRIIKKKKRYKIRKQWTDEQKTTK